MKDSVQVQKITGRTFDPETPAVLSNIMITSWRSAFRGILSDLIIGQYTQKEVCCAMFCEILTSRQGHMYLAFLKGEPAGLLYWTSTSLADSHLEALLTIPDAWGCGVGAALMDAAIKDMISLGCTRVHVWPFAQNLRAQRFYQKCGFSPSGNTRFIDTQEVEYVRSL